MLKSNQLVGLRSERYVNVSLGFRSLLNFGKAFVNYIGNIVDEMWQAVTEAHDSDRHAQVREHCIINAEIFNNRVHRFEQNHCAELRQNAPDLASFLSVGLESVQSPRHVSRDIFLTCKIILLHVVH